MAGKLSAATVKMSPAEKRMAKKAKAKKAAAGARVGAWARGQEEVSKFLQGVDVDALFKEIDTDGGGDISMEEFMGWYSDMYCRVTKSEQMDEDTADGAKSAFQNLDDDNSGALERPEIVALLNRLGVSVADFKEIGKSLGDVDVDKLFAEIDEDGGGDISCEEFVGWWKDTWCKATGNKRMNEATVTAAKKCFEELDDDNSDSLDRGEMVQLLHKLGVTMPNEPAAAAAAAAAAEEQAAPAPAAPAAPAVNLLKLSVEDWLESVGLADTNVVREVPSSPTVLAYPHVPRTGVLLSAGSLQLPHPHVLLLAPHTFCTGRCAGGRGTGGRRGRAELGGLVGELGG